MRREVIFGFIVVLSCLAYFSLLPLRIHFPRPTSTERLLDGMQNGMQGSLHRCPLTNKEKYSMIKYFVLFIGYPRSGSTLVGSLLDAHPNAIIANEYDLSKNFHTTPKTKLTKEYVFDQLLNNSVYEAKSKQRSPNFNGMFNYHVANQWQGQYKCFIQVIGDKKGARNTRQVHQQKFDFLKKIKDIIKLPIKFVHVHRNPYDNIATMVLRQAHLRNKATRNNFQAYKDISLLKGKIRKYLSLVSGVEMIRLKYPNDIFDVDYTQLLQNSTSVITQLCDFLSLECSASYLQSCKTLLFRNQTLTRHKIQWTESIKKYVASQVKRLAPNRNKFSFLQYS